MNIVIFDFATLNYGGGAEKNFMDLGIWLYNRKHNVTFITADKNFNDIICKILYRKNYQENIKEKNLIKKISGIKYYKFGIKDLFFTKKKKQICEILKNCDIIYSKNEILELVILKYFFKVETNKLVVGFHTPLYYPITNSFISKLHNFIYNSKFYQNLLFGSKVRFIFLNSEDEKKINKKYYFAVIPNPVNLERYKFKKKRRGKKFKIYYLGRMTEQKGIDILYNSIIKISRKKNFNEMEFFFVGDGPMSHYLFKLSKKFSNCHFLGYKNEVVKYYGNADLVLIPSRWETFCYVAAEAQASGVPVIASNLKVLNNVIKNKRTGFLFDLSDDNLCKFIEKVFHIWKYDYKKYRKMCFEARKYIVKEFNSDIIFKRIESFFKKNKYDKF